ncbi:MAG: DUF6116 family protein [Gammaproteobacteria bacterium]|nr:DUF6116 family protein [Gammaproteobacteria bacterium]
MNPRSIVPVLLSFANGLKFRQLFFIVAGLFVLDLLIPDMIPMIDEILLALLTIILANIKKEKSGQSGNVIDGEVVDREGQ